MSPQLEVENTYHNHINMEDKMDVDAAAGAGPAAATVSKTASSPLFNYVVSAQQPTAVTHAVVGNFTGPADVNLLLG